MRKNEEEKKKKKKKKRKWKEKERKRGATEKGQSPTKCTLLCLSKKHETSLCFRFEGGPFGWKGIVNKKTINERKWTQMDSRW